MRKTFDGPYYFESIHGHPGTFRLRIYEDLDRYRKTSEYAVVVIASFLWEHHGASIETDAEKIIAEVFRFQVERRRGRCPAPAFKPSIDSFVWIEHAPARVRNGDPEEWHRVCFEKLQDGTVRNPKWHILSKEDVEKAIRQPVE